MRSKSFILIALLTTFSFTAKTQSLTFEQTAEYIKNLLGNIHPIYGVPKASQLYEANEVKVEKSGRITFYIHISGKPEFPIGSFNVFDLESRTWDEAYLELDLMGKNNLTIGYFKQLSKPDADRLFKAIMHLKNVCTKSLDPFGN